MDQLRSSDGNMFRVTLEGPTVAGFLPNRTTTDDDAKSAEQRNEVLREVADNFDYDEEEFEDFPSLRGKLLLSNSA